MFLCFRSHDPLNWLKNLPLFLCSMQAFALPMAAFCKGRLKMAALDFVSIFGVLGMLLGTYGAGQNYACRSFLSTMWNPALSSAFRASRPSISSCRGWTACADAISGSPSAF